MTKLKNIHPFLLAALALGTGLRLVEIDAPLASDELASTSLWAQMPFLQIPVNYQFPNNHILLSLILSAILKLFGTESALLRLPVLACGVASIALGYATARRIARDTAVAPGVAFLLAISASHVYYSTNARGYILVMLFAQATFHGLIVLFQKSAGGPFAVPERPLPFRRLLGMGTLWFLGTWTLPTFALFEGSLALFFGSLLLTQYRRKLTDFSFPCVQVLLVLLICLTGLYFQYFVLLSREMLNLAVANAAPPDLADLLSGIRTEWMRPFEPLYPVFLLFALAGLFSLFKTGRATFFLFVCVAIVPPAAIYAAGKSELLAASSIPHPRVFVYIQPFFFMCAAAGARFLADQAIGLAENRLTATAKRTAANVLFGALFVPLVFLAASELNGKIYPERRNREPLHKILQFVKTLGPTDLFLTSNGPHVEFYLYGAGEMRDRVNHIVDKGELGGIYFLEDRRQNKSDVEKIRADGVDYFALAEYSQVNPGASRPEPVLIPAALVEPVTRFGNFAVHKIKPKYVRKVYSLSTPKDMARWRISASSPVRLESVKTPFGERAAIRFNGSLVMLSKNPAEEESFFDMNINLLNAEIAEDLAAAYLNGAIRGDHAEFSKSWMANVWTLDHPYGGSIFKRRWRPSIFLAKISKGLAEVVQVHMDEPGAPGALRGLTSYRVSITREELQNEKEPS